MRKLVAGSWKLVAGMLLIQSCHHFDPRSVGDPERLFEMSMRDFRRGRWGRAMDGFNVLAFDLSPRDTLLPKVRFYQSEARFGLGEYLTAARDFRRMADDFPADALAPVALLRSGDSYARLWRDIELDPSHGQTAIATYQELAGRYADTPSGRMAAVRISGLQDQLARKDYATGQFYLRRGGYDSAILYFRGIIATYPSSSVVGDAFVSLVRAYQAIGYNEERDETCAHLHQYYPARADVRLICGNRNTGR